MPVFETFAKRQKKLKGQLPDVYVYDEMPRPLRVQIVHVMHEVLGTHHECADDYAKGGDNIRMTYDAIVSTLRREMGVFRLPHSERASRSNHALELTEFMLEAPATDDFLSAVELVCRLIASMASTFDYRSKPNANEIAVDAIVEINTRFKEHGIGYEYDEAIIRIDAELVHAETVKPALSLLRDPSYAGAEEEFLAAYAHYRKGNNKEALNEALKAFESTLKSICDKRKWTYQKTDTASKLVKACFDNGLMPTFWESHFSALRTTLEAGVPTGRNKLSGHGQGSTPTSVPDHLWCQTRRVRHRVQNQFAPSSNLLAITCA